MPVRVNIRTLKQLVWLLCVLMFLYAGWTFYDIYTSKAAGDYSPRAASDFEDMLKRNVNESKLAARSTIVYPEERYRQLWDALIDGSVRKGPETGGPPPVPEPQAFVVPDLKSIVDVGLVVYNNSPIHRFIGLSYVNDAGKTGGGGAGGPGGPTMPTDGKRSRLHLSEGDPLKPPYDAPPYNGKVLRIGLQDVVFQWGEVGTEVTLTPGLGTEGTGLTLAQFQISPEEDPSASITTAPEESVQVKPDHWVMGTKDLTRMKEDPQQFLSEELNLRSITAPDGGRTQLEITEVKAGSLAAQYGAQAGDKIISVNGFPMSSVSAAINWAKANPDLPEYVIVYESKGQIKTITLYVK